MKLNSEANSPYLTVLESVRCFACGAVYGKPSGGGTVRENPGCPDCTYVGWVATRVAAFNTAWPQRHFDVGRLRHRHG